jgi:hypothetical protein
MQNERTLRRAIDFANERNGMPCTLGGFTSGHDSGHEFAEYGRWYAVVGSVGEVGSRKEAIFWWPDGNELATAQRSLYAIVGPTDRERVAVWRVERYSATDDYFVLVQATPGEMTFMGRRTLYTFERRDYRHIPGVEYDLDANHWSLGAPYVTQ